MFQSVTKRFAPIPVKLSQESQVVPDMAFTPREIIQKFSRGEKVPLGFQGLYDSEDTELDGLDQSYFEDDPTRDPNFDQFDYVEEKHALHERQQATRKRKEQATRIKQRSNGQTSQSSQRKASAEELSASDATTRATISGDDAKLPSGQ